MGSRRNAKAELRSAGPRPRAQLTAAERKEILRKTGGRCHICGGEIADKWQADHVLAHSAGGAHTPDNYLPAHAVCNNYRWDYSAEEFQEILRLGVWLRTEIEKETLIGCKAGERFMKYDQRRQKRS